MSGNPGSEVGEPPRADHQLAGNQQGPTLTDEIEGVGCRASIGVWAYPTHVRISIDRFILIYNWLVVF